jgi:hypothetical protein
MYKIMNGMDKGTQTYSENEVYEMLKQDVIYYDWSYMMSDDHRAWAQGLAVEKTIREMIHILVGVCKYDAEALKSEIKELAGEDYKDEDVYGFGLKYRTINGWFRDYLGLAEL